MIVGFFDRDRASGLMGTARRTRRRARRVLRKNDLPAPEECTEENLSLVRHRRGELFAPWEAVEPGDALELPFDPTALAPYVAR